MIDKSGSGIGFSFRVPIKAFVLSLAMVIAGFATNSAIASGFTYHIVQAASSASGSAERNFDYYIPTGYVSGTPAPLWVVLHGCRQTDRTMTDLSGFETLAEQNNAIVLYPFQNNDASSNDNDGRNPNCWGYWFDADLHRDQGEPGDIKRMVDYMKSHFSIDSNRVHLTGISSGGAMTVIGQVAYPDVFASSVIVEGIGYGETAATYTGTTDCQTVLTNNLGVVQSTSTEISKMRTEMQKSTLRQAPVLIMHNKQDCTVPIVVGQSDIDSWMGLRSADGLGINTTPTSSTNGSVDGLPYTWNKYGDNGSGQSQLETILFDVSEAQLRSAGVVDMTQDVYDTSSNTVVQEDIKRGHWWSGAPQRGPWIINKGLNAAQVAVDFFNAHPMNGSGTTTTTASGTTTTTVVGTTTTTQAGSGFQAGPGAWSSQQTWAADSVNGGNLTGFYYWPATQPVNSHGRALILVLHGCTQTASGDVVEGSDGGFNWKTTADNYGAVILAPNATGNVYSNHCWDYANTSPSRTTGHHGILLDLVNRFVTNPQYGIDPNQVYVTGLSSGGGMTMALGCLAPDIFAGIGINAGPPPGTTTAQIGYVPGGFTATNAANQCTSWAASHTASFASQITSVVWGTSDYTVAQAYGPMDAAAMRLVYGGSYNQGSNFTVNGGSGNGTGTPYTDASGKLRTTEISVSGMGHAWPAGPGGQNTNYVDSTRINYPVYVTNFWFNNNLRLAGGGSTTTTTVGGTTTTTAGGGTTTTTTATTTTTTVSTAYDQTSTDTVLNHYVAGRLNVTQYTAYGTQYGYSTVITIYHCPSLNAWTDSATCSGTGPTATTTTTAATTTTTAAATTTTTAAATTTTTAAATTTTTAAATTTTTTATTTTTTAGACYNTSNYTHVSAGRAHVSGSYALANGSNANMGLYNTFYTSKLRQTGSNYYVIDSTCP